MKKFLPLLLCLLLSIFTAALATKPPHTTVRDTRGQEADAKTSLNDANTKEEIASDDDDSMQVGSNDEGEDMNDDDGGETPGDEGTGDDDPGNDDEGDDGGGDEAE